MKKNNKNLNNTFRTKILIQNNQKNKSNKFQRKT